MRVCNELARSANLQDQINRAGARAGSSSETDLLGSWRSSGGGFGRPLLRVPRTPGSSGSARVLGGGPVERVGEPALGAAPCGSRRRSRAKGERGVDGLRLVAARRLAPGQAEAEREVRAGLPRSGGGGGRGAGGGRRGGGTQADVVPRLEARLRWLRRHWAGSREETRGGCGVGEGEEAVAFCSLRDGEGRGWGRRRWSGAEWSEQVADRWGGSLFCSPFLGPGWLAAAGRRPGWP
jgi:hypothetical protein